MTSPAGSLPYGAAHEDQVKVGGQNISTMLAGKNYLSPSGSLQSSNFATGTAGFQLTGAGAAEFNNITVRGTIIGTFKTAASGQRIEILSGAPGSMDLYSGDASETFPGSLGIFDDGSSIRTEMVNAKYGTAGDTPQAVTFYEPVANRRAVSLTGGKPNAGTRGWVYLQASGDGRVNVRGFELAPVKNLNVDGTGTTTNTVVGTISYSESVPSAYWIAESVTVSFTAGAGTVTFPQSGFANGIISVVASLLRQPNDTLDIQLDVDPDSTKTVLHLALNDSAGNGQTGSFKISYIALGW